MNNREKIENFDSRANDGRDSLGREIERGWPWPVFATTVCRERTNDEFRAFF